jgi:hypothetical protein
MPADWLRGRARHQNWSQPPTGCWTHHNLFGCGTFVSEMRFAFGSCRAFYGEPCYKMPTYPPVPVSILGPSAYGGGGCNCP